jgi:hypothetical protein
MPHTFTIQVTNAQYDAMNLHLSVGADAYVESIVEAQAKASAKEIARAEVERLLDAGLPVPATRQELIASAVANKAAP